MTSSNRLTQTSFGAPAIPARIESDPTFNGWSRDLPRLWYLDQRQATRLDAETLYGGSQFAVRYSRTQFTTLAEPIQTAAVGARGYVRESITDIGVPIETTTRIASFHRTLVTTLDEPEQDAGITLPSGGPVGPIVHPIIGASAGEGQPPIEGDPYYSAVVVVGTPTASSILLYVVPQDSIIRGVKARRTGGTDASFNLTTTEGYVMGTDLSTPIEGSWVGALETEVIPDVVLPDGTNITIEFSEVVGSVAQVEIEIEFQVAS